MKIICAYPINLDAIHDVKGEKKCGVHAKELSLN